MGMWMGIGLVIFSGIGVPLSIILKNPGLIGIWPALGVAFGVALGQLIESKYKKEGKIRSLTEDEKKKRKMDLKKLPKTTTKKKKRLGRGYGSGKGGHTVGRGAKGLKARSKLPLTFEGTKIKKSLLQRLPLRRGKGRFKS